MLIDGTTTTRTFDDEDRLTSYTIPGVGTDTFTYNGLGLRVGKTDSTGTYVYATDGASPGSPILRDGHAIFTPGLSENRGGVATFYSFDKLGNMWTLDGTSQNQTYYQDGTAFGSLFALSGSNPGGFGFSGGNGCQTDADTGLVLMGHRYYDTRLGRFISQDPVGAGGNWYAYAGNNPTNKTDPSGLTPMDGPGSSPEGSPGYMNIGGGNMARASYDMNYENFIREAASRYDFCPESVSDDAEGGDPVMTLAKDKGNTQYGQVANKSNESIVIEFDKLIKGQETLWRVTLEPGFQSCNAVDVDFILLSPYQGGYWAHLIPFVSYSVTDTPMGQMVEPVLFNTKDDFQFGFFPPASGYPYHPAFQSSTLGAWGRGYVKPISPTYGLAGIM